MLGPPGTLAEVTTASPPALFLHGHGCGMGARGATENGWTMTDVYLASQLAKPAQRAMTLGLSLGPPMWWPDASVTPARSVQIVQ